LALHSGDGKPSVEDADQGSSSSLEDRRQFRTAGVLPKTEEYRGQGTRWIEDCKVFVLEEGVCMRRVDDEAGETWPLLLKAPLRGNVYFPDLDSGWQGEPGFSLRVKTK